MSLYQANYEAAVKHTADEAPHGLVREAAALAQQIRWNPERLAEFKYPADMDLATTCCCHIVVDDPNFEISSAQFCLEEARKKNHPDCIRLATLLVRASKTQRKQINRRAWL